MRSSTSHTPGEDRIPVLLCFDGSRDAAAAIRQAADLLADQKALVLTVWEPIALWEPYDPATILSAPVARLAAKALDVDEVSLEVAQEKVARGVELAAEAGWQATGHVASGKPWRVICGLADRLDVKVIVLGGRGLGRVESALLGSVSTAVVQHAKRPVLVLPDPSGTERSPAAVKDHARPVGIET